MQNYVYSFGQKPLRYTASATSIFYFTPNQTSPTMIKSYRCEKDVISSSVQLSSGPMAYHTLKNAVEFCSTISIPSSNITVYTLTKPTPPPNFSQQFIQGQTPTSQCSAWNGWRASLTGTYSSITLNGTYYPSGVSCTGTYANTLCRALRNGVATSGACNGLYWYVGYCGSAVAISTTYSCSSCVSYGNTVAPCVTNYNWGGIDTNTCYPYNPTQVMAVHCSA